MVVEIFSATLTGFAQSRMDSVAHVSARSRLLGIPFSLQSLGRADRLPESGI